MTPLSIIVLIFIFGLLIFVHELGHFMAAKRAGVKVEEFGFGFPPRIFGVKRGETIYSLNLLPLGGFVKIFGEAGEGEGDPRSFISKKLGTRAGIVAAGVTMNVILAVFLLSVGHTVGLPTIVDETVQNNFRDVKIQIAQVVSASPAAEADLKLGDVIVRIKAGEKAVEGLKIEDFQNFIKTNAGQEVVFTIQRGGETIEKTLVPRVSPPPGEGATGIAMVKTAIVSYPWYLAVWKGIESTFTLTIALVSGFYWILKGLILKGTLIAEVAGPVGIAVLISETTKLGFNYVLQFAAVLSINLAIINFLPFPALDGGRLIFFGIEKIKGSPVNPKVEKIIHAAGFALLILLMFVVTFRDITKYIF